MRARALVAVVLALLLMGPVPPGAFWRERGDREEGILRRRPVSGGASLRLEGIEIRPSRRPRPEDEALHVWLPAEASGEARVDVRERRSNYLMRPKPERFEPGEPFTWPADAVVRLARVNVGRLRVKATADEVFYPALLSSGEFETPRSFLYEFICAASSGFDVEWRIERTVDGMLDVLAKGRREETQAGWARFTWDGHGRDGRVAPPGVHYLAIVGEDDQDHPIHLVEPFWHYRAPAP